MKWVGEIPSSWKVYKVKQIADSNNDVLPENYEEEQEIDYIEIGSVTYEHGVRTTEKMKFGNAPSRARRIVHNGDTIISTVRTYLKAIALDMCLRWLQIRILYRMNSVNCMRLFVIL